jgi:hypothetical protein
MDDMTSIDAPALTAMGVAVTGVGERLAGVAELISSWKRSGQGAIEGAITCDVGLADVARRWAGTLDDLATLVRDFGGELRAVAGDFTATDQDAAERFLGATS